MDQHLRAPTALPEDQGQVPSNHMEPYNFSSRRPTFSSGLHRRQAHRGYSHTHADKTVIYIK